MRKIMDDMDEVNEMIRQINVKKGKEELPGSAEIWKDMKRKSSVRRQMMSRSPERVLIREEGRRKRVWPRKRWLKVMKEHFKRRIG